MYKIYYQLSHVFLEGGQLGGGLYSLGPEAYLEQLAC